MKKFALLILILFLFGCIQTTKDLGNIVSREEFNVTPEQTIYSLSHCQALICKNEKGILASILDFFGLMEAKFKLTSCWFESFDPLNQTQVRELRQMLYLNSTKGYVKEFMFGIGPSLSTGDEASRLCASLGFVIHDLGGNATSDPDIIDYSLLKKYLDSEIIPVLLYYPPGTTITGYSFSGDLAINISKIDRPAILALRDYARKPPFPSYFPEEDFYRIKYACKKCLTASYIIYNNTEPLAVHSSYIIKVTGNKSLDYIDTVIYEINLNNFSCNQYKVLGAMMNFSETILDTYNKSTIAVINVSEDENCTERKIAECFDYILSYIPILSQDGMIGIAHNDLAWFFRDDGSPKTEPFNAWFGNCRQYYTAQSMEKVRKVPALYPVGGSRGLSLCPILFPVSYGMTLKCEYLNRSDIEPIDLNESFESEQLSIPDIGVKGELSAIDSSSVRALDGYEKVCERWSPQIRQFTSHYQFDYSFVRAVVWKENRFVSHSEYTNRPPLDPAEKVDKFCEMYNHTSVNYKICNGVERLKYYYLSGLNETKLLKSNGYPTKDYFPFYLSYYGYKNGEAQLQSLLQGYRSCIDWENAQHQMNKDYVPNYDRCAFNYFEQGPDNQAILAILDNARTIRKICFEDRFIDSGSPPWNGSFSGKLTKPLSDPRCDVDFNKSLGIYWNSGLILRDKSGGTSVFASTDGTVTEVGESPRFGKYTIVKNGNYLLRYSGLSAIYVKKGDFVREGDKIAETTDFLRFEICDDSNGKCKYSLTTSIKDRKFLDSKDALGIKCG